MPATNLAIVEPDHALTEPRTRKRERISPAVRKAIHLLATGECTTQKAAAERCNISPVWLCIQLKKPAGQAFLAREARQTIATGVLRASARVVQLMDASSEHVSLDASKHVLAIEGIRPPDQGQVTVNANVSVGFVLDLREDAHIGHMREIEAKPLKSHNAVSHRGKRAP